MNHSPPSLHYSITPLPQAVTRNGKPFFSGIALPPRLVGENNRENHWYTVVSPWYDLTRTFSITPRHHPRSTSASAPICPPSPSQYSKTPRLHPPELHHSMSPQPSALRPNQTKSNQQSGARSHPNKPMQRRSKTTKYNSIQPNTTKPKPREIIKFKQSGPDLGIGVPHSKRARSGRAGLDVGSGRTPSKGRSLAEQLGYKWLMATRRRCHQHLFNGEMSPFNYPDNRLGVIVTT
jgi:hypothetical protein